MEPTVPDENVIICSSWPQRVPVEDIWPRVKDTWSKEAIGMKIILCCDIVGIAFTFIGICYVCFYGELDVEPYDKPKSKWKLRLKTKRNVKRSKIENSRNDNKTNRNKNVGLYDDYAEDDEDVDSVQLTKLNDSLSKKLQDVKEELSQEEIDQMNYILLNWNL